MAISPSIEGTDYGDEAAAVTQLNQAIMRFLNQTD